LNGEKQWEEHIKTRKHNGRMREKKVMGKKEGKVKNKGEISDLCDFFN
jgi:hypothetical protein